MLTDLLEGVAKRDVDYIFDNCVNSTQKYAVSYWLNRGRSHILPRQKLVQLGIPKLDSLKYRIIGQTFALEQVLGEVASAYANTVLSRKPLVLLFAGPPGHGKSETAKQLADLLQAPFHKVRLYYFRCS
jgi:AAA+ superfamily predicted ATPase